MSDPANSNQSPPLALNTDAAAAYLQYRTTAGDAERYARFIHETDPQPAGAKPGQPAQAGKPIAPAGTAGVTLTQQPPAQSPTDPFDNPLSYYWRRDELPHRVAADVVAGTTVQEPRALYYGVREALKNVYDSYDDFGKWLDEKVGIDPHSEAFGGMDKLRQFMDTKGRIEPPESNTGKFIAGTVQFLTGLRLRHG